MSASASEPGAIPSGEAAILAAAAEAGMHLPAQCLPGVAANLALLRRHAELFLAPGDNGRATGT